jgi:hypothetical protein
MVEPPGGAGDPARQIEVQQKVLPEALAGDYAVPGDDFAQRREDRGDSLFRQQPNAGPPSRPPASAQR